MLRPFEALRLSIRHWNDFAGRSRRSEYWWTHLFYVIAIFVSVVLDALLNSDDYPADFYTPGNYGFIDSWEIEFNLFPITTIFLFITLIPILSLTVRRLHDVGRTGLLGFVTVLGSFLIPPSNLFIFEGIYTYINTAYLFSALLLLIFCIMGSQGEQNKYGLSHYKDYS